MQVTIRRAKKEDAQEIYRFVCELEEMIFDTDLFYKYYYGNISKPDYHYLVAVVEDEPIGYISCHGQVLLQSIRNTGVVYR